MTLCSGQRQYQRIEGHPLQLRFNRADDPIKVLGNLSSGGVGFRLKSNKPPPKVGERIWVLGRSSHRVVAIIRHVRMVSPRSHYVGAAFDQLTSTTELRVQDFVEHTALAKRSELRLYAGARYTSLIEKADSKSQ